MIKRALFVPAAAASSLSLLAACSSFSAASAPDVEGGAPETGAEDAASADSSESGGSDANVVDASVERYVFVTGSTTSGAFAGPGAAAQNAAAQLCASAAATSERLQNRRWYAWVATSSLPALPDVASSSTYLNVNGVVAFAPVQGTVNPGTQAPAAAIATESGAALTTTSFVWTGISSTAGSIATCDGWTTTTGAFAFTGDPSSSGPSWSSSVGSKACAGSGHLYCFEVPGP